MSEFSWITPQRIMAAQNSTAGQSYLLLIRITLVAWKAAGHSHSTSGLIRPERTLSYPVPDTKIVT